jgi:hypothetical protein
LRTSQDRSYLDIIYIYPEDFFAERRHHLAEPFSIFANMSMSLLRLVSVLAFIAFSVIGSIKALQNKFQQHRLHPQLQRQPPPLGNSQQFGGSRAKSSFLRRNAALNLVSEERCDKIDRRILRDNLNKSAGEIESLRREAELFYTYNKEEEEFRLFAIRKLVAMADLTKETKEKLDGPLYVQWVLKIGEGYMNRSGDLEHEFLDKVSVFQLVLAFPAYIPFLYRDVIPLFWP